MSRIVSPSLIATGITCLIGTSVCAQETLPPPRPVVTPEPGVQVAEQGPIHEGFAQPGSQVRGKDFYAPKAPPPPVPELPPETKPDGNNVKWVPGYWMWEDGKQDFTWVSGFWRDVPPGREWSVGEWKKSGDQFRYEPGFWKPTAMNQWRIDLPEPPKVLTTDPSTPAPHAGMTWIPGEWLYNESTGQYAWRAGHWTDPPVEMVYTPGHYRVTNYGYSYVPGYWDYGLECRGLLFAPVAFSRPLWNTPGWAFRPRFALNVGYGTGWGTGQFYSSLSIGPGFGSYFYGPYGSGWNVGLGLFPNYLFGIGYYPAWAGYAYRSHVPWWYTGGGYDNPLYRQYSARNAKNPAFAAQIHQSAVAATMGYNGVQSIPPLSRTTTPIITGAGTAGPPVVQVPAPSALVQPAPQVARQIQPARPPVVAGAIPANPPAGNAIPQGFSGRRQSFDPPAGGPATPRSFTPPSSAVPVTPNPVATPPVGSTIPPGMSGRRQSFDPGPGSTVPRSNPPATTVPAPATPRAATPPPAPPRAAPPAAAPPAGGSRGSRGKT